MEMREHLKISRAEFPSPIGELHFSIIVDWERKELWDEGFRPLSGSYISQSALTFFGIIVSGFRPLSGSYISQ